MTWVFSQLSQICHFVFVIWYLSFDSLALRVANGDAFLDPRRASFARRRSTGFSLLEVIIATAILAAGGVMLMSMFSTGDRHARRADERMIAQMLCATKLEELLADPSQLTPIKAVAIQQYPGWVYSVVAQPTSIAGFVQITVNVTHIPGTDTGANLEVATTSSEPGEASVDGLPSNLPEDPTFELSRWLEFDGDVAGFATSTGSL